MVSGRKPTEEIETPDITKVFCHRFSLSLPLQSKAGFRDETLQ